jgi:hypothetical protein
MTTAGRPPKLTCHVYDRIGGPCLGCGAPLDPCHLVGTRFFCSQCCPACRPASLVAEENARKSLLMAPTPVATSKEEQ